MTFRARPSPGGASPLADGALAAPFKGRRSLRPLLDWLGLAPFFLFAILFLLLPTANIVLGAFRSADGGVTLEHLGKLLDPSIVRAFWTSIRISFYSSVLGGALGFLIALAMTHGGLPRAVRDPLLTFSGVASNFAGVPLAFAFIATLGRLGFVTVLLRDGLGLNLYGTGFNLLSFWGLVLVYLYFQIPLAILILTPALDGLRREWREAAEILGATGVQYWRIIAVPILTPAVLGTVALLFANAFGAVATAIALTGSSLTIAPIVLFAQIRGDVLQDPSLGYAIAFGMIAVTAVANLVYIVLRTRAERWIK